MADEPYAHITDPLERVITKAIDSAGGWSGTAPVVAAAVREMFDEDREALRGAAWDLADMKDRNRQLRRENRKLNRRLAQVATNPVWELGSTPVILTRLEDLPEVTPVSNCCVTVNGNTRHLLPAAEYDPQVRELVALREYVLSGPRPFKEAGR